MLYNKIQICCDALLRLGADEIESFEDESREAKLCSSIYETIYRDCLTERPWHFAVNQAKLNKEARNPLFGYKNVFKLPADFLVFEGTKHPAIRCQVFENYVYSDCDELYINYIRKPLEAELPDYFKLYLIYRLCSDLAMALESDKEQMTIYQKIAEEQRKKIGYIDSKNKRDKRIPIQNYQILSSRL